MWKDFFYYSRSERRAVYVLLILISLLLVALIVVPGKQMSSPKILSVDSVDKEKFEAEMKSKWVRKESVPVNEEPSTLFVFDPNQADSIELSRLGLSSHVVRNILKYRRKGGKFMTPESFSRIYGLTEQKFLDLKPYIQISGTWDHRPQLKDTLQKLTKVEKKDTLRTFKYPAGTRIDVNIADTTELKKIPGIGSGIAKSIVAYRKRLGGFYSIEQLKEIEYILPAMLEWFELTTDSVQPLRVNRMGLDKLRAHPYINFYQAKVIVEHRRTKGNIKSLSQLSLYEEFTEKDLERLSAYVRFD